MNKIAITLFAAIAFQVWSSAIALDIPEALQPEVHAAEADGASLYRAVASNSSVNEESVAKAKAHVSDFCDAKYKAVESGGAVYFLAQPMTAGAIVFGRHYRVDGTHVSVSSKSCLAFPPPPGIAEASYVSHLLSKTPTEFHVYTSLVSKRPVYVGTSAGIWSVDGATIKLMELR